MKRIHVITQISLCLLILSCSHSTSPNQISTDNKPATSKFYPLALGNVWYYNSYQVGQEVDTTKYDEKWEIVGVKPLGLKQFYCIQRIIYNTDGSVWSKDTVCYCINGDSLLQILPNSPFENSTISPRAIFPDTGVTSINTRWGADSIEGYISNRTDSTITYQFWQPGWMDSGWQETYKKDVGLFDVLSCWGLGSRLVRYQCNDVN
jgi:hypothetical protein